MNLSDILINIFRDSEKKESFALHCEALEQIRRLAAEADKVLIPIDLDEAA